MGAAMELAPIALPASFDECDTGHLVHLISDLLCSLTALNDRIPLSAANISPFHSRQPPPISILDYLRRIVKFAALERACLLATVIFIDRVCQRHPTFTISSLTVHRFLVAATTIAAKSICDAFFTNALYAKVGGITTLELNALELELLRLADWQVAVSGPLLQEYYHGVIAQSPHFVIRAPPSPTPSHVAIPLSPPAEVLLDPFDAPSGTTGTMGAAKAAELRVSCPPTPPPTSPPVSGPRRASQECVTVRP
ncbi:hypothetical protein AMAG_01175 [Allomyces macrogynus ATCC 38327]|uniref:Cyclin-domain-containing protein n=1 Tax=Allomyces macrogynus (strain ATCC 38327) TaxID=578462 RepID=A0A0L0RXZ0_ALLM3|nr:hypothetical protein AMAG_01175 [Allomyces macrogynus ATCC 38327]|eukprot:KNE55262.1 hypothetical protein AMAG_01175 [Allomyces macrogynus ATCC 38327]